MKFRGVKRTNPELDIAPLIDVVFLLLIFFLLSSPFIMQPGIRIKLPKAATSEVQPQRDIFILIDAKERIFLNERYVKDVGSLKEKLMILIDKGRSTVIIKADENVRHRRVVEVMDIAKQVGIGKLAIATQPIGWRREGGYVSQ